MTLVMTMVMMVTHYSSPEEFPKAIPAYFAFGKNPLISMNTRKKKALTRFAFEILNLFNIYFCNS